MAPLSARAAEQPHAHGLRFGRIAASFGNPAITPPGLSQHRPPSKVVAQKGCPARKHGHSSGTYHDGRNNPLDSGAELRHDNLCGLATTVRTDSRERVHRGLRGSVEVNENERERELSIERK